MARFCASCGAQMDDTAGFCPACGKAVADAAAGAPATGPAAAPAASSGLTDNVAGLLCYVPFGIGLICSIVFLVIEPYKRSRFVRFHAIQSLALALACFAIAIALSIVGSIFAAIMHFLVFLMFPIWGLFWLAIFVLLIVMMLKANQGQMYKLPYLGDFAEKQAGA